MAITYIPYNPQTDPKQYLVQALQQGLSGYLAHRQRQQFQKGLSPTMTPMQLFQKALQSGYSPQEAMGFTKLAPTMLQQAQTIKALRPEKISPSQQISQKKLNKINKLQAKVKTGTASKAERAMLDKMLGASTTGPFTQGRIQQTLGELEAGGAQDIFGMTIEFSSRKDATDHALRKLGPKWKELAPEAAEIIDRKWPEKGKYKIGQIINNPTTGERRKWNGKKWVPIR